MLYCSVTRFLIKNTVHSFPSQLMYFSVSPCPGGFFVFRGLALFQSGFIYVGRVPCRWTLRLFPISHCSKYHCNEFPLAQIFAHFPDCFCRINSQK